MCHECAQICHEFKCNGKNVIEKDRLAVCEPVFIYVDNFYVWCYNENLIHMVSAVSGFALNDLFANQRAVFLNAL